MFSKFTATLVFSFVLLAALAHAEPPRYRTSRRSGALRTNIRFLARQEVEAEAPAPSPAPYPAAGVTPETPFELPTEAEAAPAFEPEQAYGPPDQTYGPPEAAEPAVEPDNIYGPPESAQPAAEEPESNVASQNIIQPRGRGRGRFLRLTAVPVPQQFAPRAGLVEIIRSEPILVYTLKK